ncbi:MAG: DNA-directed RNA polymerase subunit alpha [Candidatus Azobacteroides pseudotrichonymphae]|jgi:DNA-directed RNA polymerase subunit alpha|uniref:DNA-directed RNA polymerase subunit alpha n=1 Tax=Azobacteroides pseudotrichonymphae genomovar. CFP2 TaxID=511995 RepID=B6YQ60_AZOPC|nr:DNA-directed RNA polymerase subunit alpha [Candidatus Azobacteroides pseudotrichonymphae]MDR0530124.1 DNA-directed RNA polymerase subunit alpha [Bacteroidales bacterium OttesenSCG-928-I14]BAG83332.1 DNA-directed RNA polymerase alpha subunit [Candidatus Azobacteroides pseudotrichonymphae genomovar. CFP2]GMO37022.1 MAG: DNA-directed RNA polymerase subunit alpha [Candidatus Azobacteroides pseudotrichonymphae]
MAILMFQKPDRVIEVESGDKYGKFEFHPLESGYGITIGNSLRRVLLSSLEGYAITSIKIEGVSNEFAVVPGVVEDVTNIILKLKQVRFKRINKDFEYERVVLTISETDKFKADDISKRLSGFEVVNSDFIIAHLDKSANLNIELTIRKGRGYVPSEENYRDSDDVNQIAIDSVFTPIVNVKYNVESFRVEQKTDYEKLTIEIMTDGSVCPKIALKSASDILIQHLELFSEGRIRLEKDEIETVKDFDEDVLRIRQLLKSKLSDMELSVRALNCLKAEAIETLEDLVKYQKSDLMKFRNFGKKSLVELDELLAKLNLTFGMDIEKYKFG